MERDQLQTIFEIVEDRLSDLDQITRREVLKRLLKSSAFLALLSGGGAGLFAPALAGATEHRFITSGALTAPAPDRQFKNFRTELVEGTRAMLDQIVQDTLIDLGYGPGGSSLPTGKGIMEGTAAGAAPGCADEAFVCESFNCPDVNECWRHDCSGGNTCGTHICGIGGFTCSGGDTCSGQATGPGFCMPINICAGENCSSHVCDPVDTCTNQTNPGGNCTGGVNSCTGERCTGLACLNVCEDQSCPGNTCSPESANVCGSQTCASRTGSGLPSPEDFIKRYGKEPFVRELKDLFGQNLLEEIASMIRDKVTLRGRGLIDPGAPPAPSAPTLDTLRDLPGARMPQPPAQPGVQPPAATTAPTAPPAAPAAPPTVTPTAPPPAAPPPVYTPPVHKPPVVAPTPVAPPPVVPAPVVPAPVAPPITPAPITPPKPIQ